MKKKKCYIYTRVSTSVQVDGYSLDAQKDKLRKYADFQDFVIAGEYSDEGFSGKNIQGRREFQKMLTDIQNGTDGIEYVLVFKLSRFGRNAADVLNALQLMQDYGVNLICVEDGIDSSKDAGKLMISVLSAVAEIERENIRTQTMSGREQKAREGKWNGGFAPYGYKLENGVLKIAEDEVEIVKLIYERYLHSNKGAGDVAAYLNRHGYKKKTRQNNTLDVFTAHFVRVVLENPVYMGKIAYGRRKTEKIVGTRNEMHLVRKEEYPLYEGQHEAIISEEDWKKAEEKRKKYKPQPRVGSTKYVSLLSTVVKCPVCGKSMYSQPRVDRRAKKVQTNYYYYCTNSHMETGHSCSFRTCIEQELIDRIVVEVVLRMIRNSFFENVLKESIGTSTDTSGLELELQTLKGKLRQAEATKDRLEKQMDSLDSLDPYYDRKIRDLQFRYDNQYDIIGETETDIEKLEKQIDAIQANLISEDHVMDILNSFDLLYKEMAPLERRDLIRSLVKQVDLYDTKPENDCWVKSITFQFPIPISGGENAVNTGNNVETVCLLTKNV